MDDTVKQIKIEEPTKVTKTKKILCQKERKMRVETKFWGLNEDELSHAMQLDYLINDTDEPNKSEYMTNIIRHIKNKIGSYRQQDVLKNKYNESKFVSLSETMDLLKSCEMKCCYCSEKVYVLYEHVREMKQWSLDRIDNNIGHNIGNLVIACLECNLKRRRTNKDAFMFTKNMVIIKEGQSVT
jgi:5-methylcytosine-specific restriction endonuclease McrA